jgi:hypothetical protein
MLDEETVYRWSLRLLESQRAIAETPAEEAKAYEAHLGRMKELEKAAPERIVMVPVPPNRQRWEEQAHRGRQGWQKVGHSCRTPAALAARGRDDRLFPAEAEVWLAEAKSKKH